MRRPVTIGLAWLLLGGPIAAFAADAPEGATVPASPPAATAAAPVTAPAATIAPAREGAPSASLAKPSTATTLKRSAAKTAVTKTAVTKTATKPGGTKTGAAKSTATNASAAKKTGNAATAKTTNAGRLEDIHIEGEIPMPQVLFITARDQRRFMDVHTRRYLRTSLEVGEQTVYPTRIGLTRTTPTDTSQEASR